MKKGSIEQAYKDVYTFNDVAGNYDDVDENSIDNQISYVFEECAETITAFEEGDVIELLDGACDLFVVVAGLLQKLEVAGFDVETALKRVNHNNLSKYIPSGQPVQYKEGWTSEYNSKHHVTVLKDASGKIMKKIGFVPVDLKGLAPEDFFKGRAV